jgi:hypothetical protein
MARSLTFQTGLDGGRAARRGDAGGRASPGRSARQKFFRPERKNFLRGKFFSVSVKTAGAKGVPAQAGGREKYRFAGFFQGKLA